MLTVSKNIALLMFYIRGNRYSYNALVGAIETDQYLQDLDIYFANNKDDLHIELNRIIKKYEKVIIAISFATTQLWDINELIKDLKEEYSDKPLYIAGGPHPTGDPLGTLKMGFNIVVRGEGEETLIEIIKRIDNNKDYKEIKGISFIDNKGKCHSNDKRSLLDLNKYPPFAIKHKKFGPIEITRGCPFVCYFCQTPYIFGGRVRHRSIESICKYVHIMKDLNLTDIRFITPNSFSYGSVDGKQLNVPKLEELLRNIKEILKSNGRIFLGSFPSEVRPEHVTEETLYLIKKYANNDNLIIGAQSGSQRILDFCNRGHTVEDIFNAVNLTIKFNFKANVDFIFGLPGETEKDVKLTIKFMNDLIAMGAKIHAHTFMPLPQTKFAMAIPQKITKQIKLEIQKLSSKGVIYGDWAKQEKYASMISTYLRKEL